MKTVLNVKTDAKLKKAAQRVAKEAGIPLSLVVNNALSNFVSHRAITLRAPLKPSKWLEKVLRETEKDLEEGKNIEGPFYSAEEFMKGLKS